MSGDTLATLSYRPRERERKPRVLRRATARALFSFERVFSDKKRRKKTRERSLPLSRGGSCHKAIYVFDSRHEYFDHRVKLARDESRVCCVWNRRAGRRDETVSSSTRQERTRGRNYGSTMCVALCVSHELLPKYEKESNLEKTTHVAGEAGLSA